jgi:hypothetical protein
LRTDNEFTKILDWPGYPVYQHELDENAKTLKLWIRRKRGHRKIECSGYGRKFRDVYDTSERCEIFHGASFTATVMVAVYRVNCPDCGVKREKVPLLPSEAPFSQRFEDAARPRVQKSALSPLEGSEDGPTKTEFVDFKKAA